MINKQELLNETTNIRNVDAITNVINLSNEKHLSINFCTKKNGVFFTKDINLIYKIINNIYISPELINKKILEPSCGNGLLILGLIQKFYDNYPDKDLIYSLINDAIYFNDINSSMIKETIRNIKYLYLNFFKEEYTGTFNATCFDFTDITIKYDFYFDYIIGNPPYITLYGRRDKKENEKQRTKFLKDYKQFPKSIKNGKLNYTMFFIERAFDLLKSDANMTYILDLAFFETAYKYTRKFLLENATINALEYNIKGFDVASGQIILSVTKGKNEIIKTKIINSTNNKISFISQDMWYNPEDDYKFRLNLDNDKLNSILRKIDKHSPKTLKELFPKKNLRTGCMLLNMESEFISNNKKINSYPYYQGAKSLSAKYSKLTYNNFFNLDVQKQNKLNEDLKQELEKRGIKNKKRIGFGEEVIYKNPKLYIRQSAKEVLATYDQNESCCNNNLYIFSLRNNDKKSIEYLKFLCGFLNSDLITFYAQQRNIIRYFEGKQPQIKIGDLYSIKIIEDKETQKHIAHLVEQIYQNGNLDIYTKQINKVIYKYYELNDSQVAYIKSSIKDFLAS